ALDENGPDRAPLLASVAHLRELAPCLAVRRAPLVQLVAALEPRIGPEAEVADAPRELGHGLRRHIRVALPVDVRRAQELLARDDRDLRLAEDLHRGLSSAFVVGWNGERRASWSRAAAPAGQGTPPRPRPTRPDRRAPRLGTPGEASGGARLAGRPTRRQDGRPTDQQRPRQSTDDRTHGTLPA